MLLQMAMNMGVQLSLQILISFPLGTEAEVELLDHMVVLFLIFKEPLYCFP